jgi:hypothetical protein
MQICCDGVFVGKSVLFSRIVAQRQTLTFWLRIALRDSFDIVSDERGRILNPLKRSEVFRAGNILNMVVIVSPTTNAGGGHQQ